MDRTVATKLSVDVEYAGLGKAAADARELRAALQDVAKTEQGLNRTATASKRLGQSLPDKAKVDGLAGGLTKIANKSGDIDKISSSMLKVGGALAVGIGASAKAAMDWETQWAGVRKTVDGSTQFLDQLEGQLRDMAKTMPVTHAEIAATAEAAGQLGVQSENVAAFTQEMVKLGATTNLTADEAATMSAQFTNIMGTMKDKSPQEARMNMQRLSATIVDLGNKGASTESQILDMGQRIAGAGKLIGLNENQVLAYANAVASVGINAEAGGTAVATTFTRLDKYVKEGSDKLEVMAEVAGMAPEAFADAWNKDAATAMESFIKGLGNVAQNGGDVNSVLSQLKINGIREGSWLRSLAVNSDILSDSLMNGKTAWEQASAANEEYDKRLETTQSKVTIAWNNIKDASIDAGAALLPVVADMAGALASLAQSFGKLSPEAQSFTIKAGATAAVLLLVAGGGLKAATAVAGLYQNIVNLSGSIPAANAKLKGLAGAASAVGLAYAAVAVAGTTLDTLGRDVVSVEDMTRALAEFTKTSDGAALSAAALGKTNFADTLADQMFQTGNSAKDFNEALELSAVRSGQVGNAFERNFLRIGASVQDFTAGLIPGQQGMEKTTRAIANVDSALSEMVSGGNWEQAGSAFEELTKNARWLNQEDFSNYRQSLVDMSESQLGVTLSAEELDGWMRGKVPDSIRKAAKAAKEGGKSIDGMSDEMRDSLAAADALSIKQDALGRAQGTLRKEVDKVRNSFSILRGEFGDAEAAAGAYEDALDEAEKSIIKTSDATVLASEKNGELAKTNRDNRETIRAVASALNDKVTSQFKDTESTKGLKAATDEAAKATKNGREQIEDLAVQAGMSRKEAKKYADQLILTPDEVKTQVKTPGIDEATGKVKDLQDQIDGIKSVEAAVDIVLSASTGKVVVDSAASLVKQIAKKRAMGGPVYGPGTETSDSILTALSNGEFVIRAKAVRAIGVDRLNRMNATGRVEERASGGIVGRDLTVRGVSSEAPAIDMMAARIIQGGATAIGKAVAKELQNAQPATGVPLGSNELVALRGHRFTENFANRLRAVEKVLGTTLNITQGGWRPATSYSGTSHAGDAVDIAQPFSTMTWQTMRRYGIAAWDRTGKGNWISHIHGVPLPFAGKAGGSAVWQAQDYLRGGDGLGGRDSSSAAANRKAASGSRKLIAGMAGGGLISGPGGPLDDLVPIMGSNGEFMFRAAAVNHWGLGLLEAMNAAGDSATAAAPAGLANGGKIYGRPSQNIDMGVITRLMRTLVDPVKEIAKAGEAVKRARVNLDRENRAIIAPKRNLSRATARYRDAVDDRDDARARNAKELNREKAKTAKLAEAERKASEASEKADKRLAAARSRKAGKGTIAELQREARAAQAAEDKAEAKLAKQRAAQAKVSRDNTAEMAKLNKRVSDTSKDKTKAQEAYNKVADKAKVASEKLKDAQQALAEQQKELADAASQTAAAFSGLYESQSTDPTDWITKQKEGAADLQKLAAVITKLRAAGLNEETIAQVIAMGQERGAAYGLEFGNNILAGGKGTVDQLNKSVADLAKAAQGLGVAVNVAPKRADGGLVGGIGGPRSDRTLLWASPGEMVVNERSTRRYLPELRAMNAGTYQGSVVNHGPRMDMTVHQTVYSSNPDLAAQKAAARLRDAAYTANLMTGAIAS